MRKLTHDRIASRSPVTAGLGLATVSAASFGLSGALGRGLLDAGWTPGAAVTARLLIAAAALVVPAVLSMRGRWHLVRGSLALLTTYGVVAVAGCQLCYFYAVDHMQVGVALLVEYTAPVAVVGWLWARHGQRPGRLTVLGGVIAAGGLGLALAPLSGADLSPVGVLWALGAMVGVAAYFVISADETNGLPPIVLAAAGLVVGGLVLLLAGVLRVVPLHATTAEVRFTAGVVPWWVPVLALGLVTAALAYVAGIGAGRRLGSRLASFVGLLEVLAALVFAWLLLDQLPGAVQVVGGALVLAGVVVVKLGEPRAVVEPGTLEAPGVAVEPRVARTR